MKWIKASEPILPDNKEYFVIADGIKTIGIYEGGYFWKDDKLLNVTKWLDESPPPVQSDSGLDDIISKYVGNPSRLLRIDVEKTAVEYASLKTKELREALEEIEKSLYIGDDLNDKEILHFYVEVVKTIKKEIHKALNNKQ